MAVSRDCCLMTLVVQALVVACAAIVWVIDSSFDQYGLTQLNGGEPCLQVGNGLEDDSDTVIAATATTTTAATSATVTDEYFLCNQYGTVYYLAGLVIFLCLFGLGFCFWTICFTDCRQNMLQNGNHQPPQQPTNATSNTAASNTNPQHQHTPEQALPPATPSFYRRKRSKSIIESRRGNCFRRTYALQQDCCLGVAYSVYQTESTCGAICTRCREHRDDSSQGSGGSGGGDDDEGGECEFPEINAEVVMVSLYALLAALIMIFTVTGLIIAMVIVVVAMQQLAQRHYYFMHKRRLVKEFSVIDLSSSTTTSTPTTLLAIQQRPNLDSDDVDSLRRFGLVQ